MNLQPYDLLFYKGNDFISNIIKKETNSPYSHVALVLDDKHLIEIDKSYNLRIGHLGYSKQSFDIYRLKEPISFGQQMAINEYIYETINSKYDFIEILDILLLKFFKFTIKNDPNKFICSSWINDCLWSAAGIELSNKEYPTPQELISDKLYKVEQ